MYNTAVDSQDTEFVYILGAVLWARSGLILWTSPSYRTACFRCGLHLQVLPHSKGIPYIFLEKLHSVSYIMRKEEDENFCTSTIMVKRQIMMLMHYLFLLFNSRRSKLEKQFESHSHIRFVTSS